MSKDKNMENPQKLSALKVLCISASNRINATETNSYKKCKVILDEAGKHIIDVQSEIVELQKHSLNPCTDCEKCKDINHCVTNDDFNYIYEKIIACDVLFIVAPHYALIPAKLVMLLERMGQIIFWKRRKDKSYQGATFGKKTAIITHGATAVDDAARKRKKRLLNDPLANALHANQMNVIPFDDEWDTGICVQPIEMNHDGETVLKISEYVRKVIDNF